MNMARSAVLALVLLAGCASAPTRVYTVEPVHPRGGVSYTGPAVRVDAVHVPPAFDRTEILSDLGNGELRVNDTEHWSAPLGQLVSQALTADLMERLPPGRVIFPHLSRPADAVGISVDMLALTRAAGGLQLSVSWALWVGASAGQSAVPRMATAALHSDLPAANTAQALSDLVAQLADRIAADLADANH